MTMLRWLLALVAALALTDGTAAARDRAVADGTRMLLKAHPAGSATPTDSVLYDQIPEIGPYQIPVANYAGTPIDGGTETHAADDFDVTDAAGWTITGFDLVLCCQPDGFLTDEADIYVYPTDPQNFPAAVPVCSVPGVAINWNPEDITSTGRVELPQPCVLGPGKYWLAPAGSESKYYRWFAYSDGAARGLPGLWRVPDGSYGEACRQWSSINRCYSEGVGHDPKFNFRVLGHVGREPGALDLTVTLAPFDAAAPETCGSATELTVTIGDRVSVCYSITNRSGTDLRFHTLHDSLDGDLFVQREQTLALHERMTYQRVITAGLESDIAATWTARNFAASYRVDDSTPMPFVELSVASGATELLPYGLPMNDDGAAIVPLPFPFPLFGRTDSLLCVGNNGYLMLGSSAEWPFCSPAGLWANGALPNAQLGWPAILPAWMDLYVDGTTYYQTLGEPGSRRFVVEWDRRNRWAVAPAPGAITFEVILEEATGAISFLYRQMAFGDAESPAGDYGEQATVGLQEGPTSALQYSFGQPLLTNGKAIRWTPSVTDDFTQTTTAQLAVGAPTVGATPAALAATLTAGAAETTTLRLSNSGDRDLIWNVESARPTLHFPPGTERAALPANEAKGARFGRAELNAARAFKIERKRLEALRHPLPRSGEEPDVPAYATYGGIGGDDRVRLLVGSINAAAAGEPIDVVASHLLEPLGPPPFNYAFLPSGGAFVDNDFTRLYAITQGGAFGYIDLARGGALEVITIRAQATGTGDTQWCTFVPAQPCWYGLTWDAATRSLYTMGIIYRYDNTDPDYVPISSQLHRVDLETGLLTAVGAPVPGAEFSDLAVDPQGLMYAVDPTADALYAIDKTTGEARAIGSLGFDARGSGYMDQSLSFDPSTGVLWYAATRFVPPPDFSLVEMYTVDTLTGRATFRSPQADNWAPGSFEIAVRSGPCSRPGEIPWLSYPGITEGIQAPNGSAEVAVRFDAQDLTPGVYEADVCVFSNDPVRHNHPLSVPVRLSVTADGAERIFADGFETPAP